MLFPFILQHGFRKNGRFLNWANWKMFSNVLHVFVSSRAHHWSEHLLDWISQDCTLLHGARAHFSGTWTFERCISWMKISDQVLGKGTEKRKAGVKGQRASEDNFISCCFFSYSLFYSRSQTDNEWHPLRRSRALFSLQFLLSRFPWYHHLSWAGFNVVQKLFPPTSLFPTYF